MSDIESRIQQIASVLSQLDDSQVPRNIRTTTKESVDKWLLEKTLAIAKTKKKNGELDRRFSEETIKALNKNKEMDLRLGMTASMLDDIFNDPNLPLHFGPLCLQIQTALETLLAEARRK